VPKFAAPEPKPEPEPEPELVEVEPPPVAVTIRKATPQPPVDEEERAPVRRRPDEDEPRPRKRRRPEPARGNSAVVWVLVAVGAILLVCGGGVAALVLLINQAASNSANNLRKAANARHKNMVQFNDDKAQVVVPVDNQKDKVVVPGNNDKGKIFQVPLNGLMLSDKLAVNDPRDTVYGQSFCKIYQVWLVARKTYTIRMNAQDQRQIDALLRLEDANFKQLAENDDAPGEKTLNSRIDFICPQTGVYRVIATSFRPNEVGNFTLTINRTK